MQLVVRITALLLVPAARRAVLAAIACAAIACAAVAAGAGAAERDIVVGSLLDLSGRLAGPAADMRNGLQMRLDEENEFGGIGGRRLRLATEDARGDAAAARAAALRLLQRERPLVVLGSVGPEAVAAAAPILAERRIPDLFAATPVAGVGTATPLRFRYHADHARLMPLAIRYLARANGYRRPALVHQDDAYGREVRAGFDAALAELGLDACERAGYAPGGIAAAIERVRARNCDFLVLGSFPDDVAAGLRAAREGGWLVAMLATPLAYGVPALAAAGEGLWALAPTPLPRPAEDNPALGRWVERYGTRFGQAPGTFSVLGYVSADFFVAAAQKAGARLDAAGLAAALESMEAAADHFGHPAFTLAADGHAGNRSARLAQVRGGRWQLVSEPLR